MSLIDNTLSKKDAVKVVGENTVKELLDEGIYTEQLIDGKTFMKPTSKSKEMLTDLFIKKPVSSCIYTWNQLVDECRDINIFMIALMQMHSLIKDTTNSQVDFIDIIYKEIKSNGR